MYEVKFTETAMKDLEKLDKQTIRLIKNWVVKNLATSIDPRQHGHGLNGNLKGLWRYRVGDYRLIAEIQDSVLIIIVVAVGHRRNIHK